MNPDTANRLLELHYSGQRVLSPGNVAYLESIANGGQSMSGGEQMSPIGGYPSPKSTEFVSIENPGFQGIGQNPGTTPATYFEGSSDEEDVRAAGFAGRPVLAMDSETAKKLLELHYSGQTRLNPDRVRMLEAVASRPSVVNPNYNPELAKKITDHIAHAWNPTKNPKPDPVPAQASEPLMSVQPDQVSSSDQLMSQMPPEETPTKPTTKPTTKPIGKSVSFTQSKADSFDVEQAKKLLDLDKQGVIKLTPENKKKLQIQSMETEEDLTALAEALDRYAPEPETSKYPQNYPEATQNVRDTAAQYFDDQNQSIEDQYQVDYSEAKAIADDFNKFRADFKAQELTDEQAERQRRARVERSLDELDVLSHELGNYNEDPSRWWNSRTTGQKILAGIALFFGSFSHTSNNKAVSVIMDAINKDIEAQRAKYAAGKDKIAGKRTVLGLMREQFADDRAAEAATKVAMIDEVNRQIQQRALDSNSEKVKIAADRASSQLAMERAKFAQEFEAAQMAIMAQMMVGRGGSGANTKGTTALSKGLQPFQKEMALADSIEARISGLPDDLVLPGRSLDVVDRTVRTLEDWALGEGHYDRRKYNAMESELKQVIDWAEQVSLQILTGAAYSEDQKASVRAAMAAGNTVGGLRRWIKLIREINAQQQANVMGGADPKTVEVQQTRTRAFRPQRETAPVQLGPVKE